MTSVSGDGPKIDLPEPRVLDATLSLLMDHKLPPPSPIRKTTVSGWGRTFAEAAEIHSEDLERATRGASLSRGLGRSYGDASLPADAETRVVNTALADRILAFDAETGRIRVEAGFSLRELVRLFLPRGWFTPVSPGTQYVTVGGMAASDVHGKNHHREGSFGNHVRSLKMRTADDRIVECSAEQHPDLFFATLGGMGLTGHILEVDFQLKQVSSPWVWSQSMRIPDVDAFIEALREEAPRWPYTVGWIDCLSPGKNLGRGILMTGRWATADEAPKKFPSQSARLGVPFEFPSWVLNPVTSRLFNWLYYRKHWRKRREGIVHPASFFYPLDAVRNWNRVYGRRGMTQHQCVLPPESIPASTRELLRVLTENGGASPLCVIKDFGAEGQGLLSFPKPGITIATDLPIREDTPALISKLNAIVIKHGGRVYLTKDSFTTREDFLAMDPRLQEFEAVRKKWDPSGQFRSAQSARIFEP